MLTVLLFFQLLGQVLQRFLVGFHRFVRQILVLLGHVLVLREEIEVTQLGNDLVW